MAEDWLKNIETWLHLGKKGFMFCTEFHETYSLVSRKCPRMSNPRMSNAKMSNPRMSNPRMSNAKMSK